MASDKINYDVRIEPNRTVTVAAPPNHRKKHDATIPPASARPNSAAQSSLYVFSLVSFVSFVSFAIFSLPMIKPFHVRVVLQQNVLNPVANVPC